MEYFAGLDVSLEETAICIVDDAGLIVREARVASEPEALVASPNRSQARSTKSGARPITGTPNGRGQADRRWQQAGGTLAPSRRHRARLGFG